MCRRQSGGSGRPNGPAHGPGPRVHGRYTASVMPTYEYACRSCGHTFEVVQSMVDDSLTVCPRCEGELRKVFAPPAIAFKGSGFYATDHGRKARPKETSDGGTSGDAGEKGGDTKSKPGEKTGEKTGEKKSTSKTNEGGSGGSGGSGSSSSTAPAKPAAKEATSS